MSKSKGSRTRTVLKKTVTAVLFVAPITYQPVTGLINAGTSALASLAGSRARRHIPNRPLRFTVAAAATTGLILARRQLLSAALRNDRLRDLNDIGWAGRFADSNPAKSA